MTTPRAGNSAPHQKSPIAKYRWHVVNYVATDLGWVWRQLANTVDELSRNGVVYIVSWGEQQMAWARGPGLEISARESAKLEKFCRALGADIRDGQKFENLPTGHVARLRLSIPALRIEARVGLKVIEESPAPSDQAPVAVGTSIDMDDSPSIAVDHAGAVECAVPGYAIALVAVDAIPEEQFTELERIEFERILSGLAEPREARLRSRFREYLLRKNPAADVRRYRITTPSGDVLYTDTADITAGILYEAKGTVERMNVRLALGQVLDYGRYVAGGINLAVLLPEKPASDLVELLNSHNIGCVVETAPGEFADLTGLGRCP